MKTRNDDFSNGTHPEEQNITGSFVYKSPDGKYYKLELDFSPKSFISVVKSNCIRKPLPWQEYVRHTEEEKKANNGRAGHYIVAKGVDGLIGSMIEESGN